MKIVRWSSLFALFAILVILPAWTFAEEPLGGHEGEGIESEMSYPVGYTLSWVTQSGQEIILTWDGEKMMDQYGAFFETVPCHNTVYGHACNYNDPPPPCGYFGKFSHGGYTPMESHDEWIC